MAAPLTEGEAAALFHHLRVQLGPPDRNACDHTLRLAREWCEAQPIEWLPVRDWLHSLGGYCACEAVMNVEGRAA